MVEIQASDWTRSVKWYTNVLGLQLLLEDPAHRFALLEAGSGRIAVKGGNVPGADREAIRLTFQVDDVDAERARLIGLETPVGEPVENRDEGYRAIRLEDPDGTPIRLFCWSDRPGGASDGSPTEDRTP
jgi:catechol 2,3-dioxygenase-like lactoylglutathione lyase family enzyme